MDATRRPRTANISAGLRAWRLASPPVAPLAAFLAAMLTPAAALADAPVSLLGQGKARAAQELDAEDLAKLPLGTNPLKALEKLPGVLFEAADAQGNYEWSMRFALRGFNQSQLGFTLDGVPLGDMSYTNHNGLHITRAISPENLASVTVSQGSGSVGTASTSNLGGTVQFVSSNPRPDFGVSAKQLIGSDAMTRSFVRLDTGESEAGTRAYLSVMHQTAEKWKGWGDQDLDQINARLVHDFGSTRLSAFVNASDRLETDYQDLSLSMIDRLGWQRDNFAPDWGAALAAANACATPPGAYDKPICDEAYFLGRGLRRDLLAGVKLNGRLGPAYWASTVYSHRNEGQGHWYTPYQASPTGVPVSIRTTEYEIDRIGWVNDLTWHLGNHRVQAGLWLERSKHGLERNFYAVTGPGGSERFLSRPFITDFAQDFLTKTAQVYVLDTFSILDDALTFSLGGKSPHVQTTARARVGNRAAGELKSDASFLPQASANWLLAPGQEIFTSITKNQRAFQAGVMGPFIQRQVAFDVSASRLKPEKSVTVEVGYRFQGEHLSGSLTAYKINFTDRLLAVAPAVPISGAPEVFINVGEVGAQGLEGAMVLPVGRHWSLFGSATYNKARYLSNYEDNGITIHAKDKTVVDTPRTMAALELSYDNGVWDARLAAKYVGRRYYTYLNDAPVSGFTLANVSLGYQLGNIREMRDIGLRLNVSNLSDKHHIATLGTNGYFNSDPAGTRQTLLPGAPRQVFLSVSGKF